MDQQEILRVLDYSIITGKFYWKIRPSNCNKVGDKAGFSTGRYCQIRYKGKLYYGHQLAFLYVLGFIPKEIDHADQDKNNNSWLNLSDVSRTVNSRNVAKTKNNTSGVTGVCWDKNKQMWMAKIMIAGKTKFLGYSHSLSEAASFRQQANAEYGFSSNHGK